MSVDRERLSALVEPPTGKYDFVLKPFIAMMEAELHANSGKGDRPGWLAMSREEVLFEIYYHLAKLQKAVRKGDADGIREYAADVANMSMMAVDICGAWHSPRPSPLPRSFPMTTTETVKLAPCPFCGGEARIHEFADVPDCGGCHALGPVADTVPEAIAAWNRRAGGEVEPVAANVAITPEQAAQMGIDAAAGKPTFLAALATPAGNMVTPNPAPSGEAVPVAATLKAIDNHLRVQQQVAARSNLVGYAAEFYAALRHTLPDAIRAALSPNGSDAE